MLKLEAIGRTIDVLAASFPSGVITSSYWAEPGGNVQLNVGVMLEDTLPPVGQREPVWAEDDQEAVPGVLNLHSRDQGPQVRGLASGRRGLERTFHL